MKALGRGALDRTGARRRILTETSRFFVHVCRAALHVKTLARHTARRASFFLTVLAVQLPGFRPRVARGLKPTAAPQTTPPPTPAALGLEEVSTGIEETRMSVCRRATALSLFGSFREMVFRGICPE